MPAATTKELTSSRPRLPRCQAAATLAKNSPPGSAGGGTASTSAAECEPTTKANHSGRQTSSPPTIRIPWQAMSIPRLRSTMLDVVVHIPLDVAELNDGEGEREQHHQHRLRRRRAEVDVHEAVDIDLVDQDHGGAAGAAVSHRVDDGKGLEEA